MARMTSGSKKGLGAFSAIALGLGAVVTINMAANADYVNPGANIETAIPADALAGTGFRNFKDWGDRLAAPSGNDTEGGSRVSGNAVIMDTSTSATDGGGNTPIPEGTPIYLRWVDGDGAVSPIYTAKTQNNFKGSSHGGTYAFSLPPFSDVTGKKHFYLPGVAKKQKTQVWFEPYTSPTSGQLVVPIRTAINGLGNPAMGAASLSDSNNVGSTYLDLQYINHAALFGYEMPAEYMSTPKNQWIKSSAVHADTLPGMKNYTVNGKVWIENRGATAGQGPMWLSDDSSAEGFTVVMSALSPICQPKAESIKKDYPRAQWTTEMKKLIQTTPGCVLETVYDQVGKNGKYAVQFSKEAYNHGRTLYGYVIDPTGHVLPSYSSFTDNFFNAPNERIGQLEPQIVPGTTDTIDNQYWYNVNFAVVPYYGLGLTLDKDVIENIGGEATPKISGYSYSPVGNMIRWTDKNGNVVKECKGLTHEKVGADGIVDTCKFAVPEGTQSGDFFTATLYAGETPDTILGTDYFEYQERAKVEPSFFGTAPEVTGIVDELLPEKVVTVNNPDGFKGLTCTSPDLANGLQIYYDEAKGGCVISGTPTEVTPEGATYTAVLSYVVADGSTKSVQLEGNQIITEPGDDDGDGVNNHDDKCPGTPEGATVNAEGCSDDPSVNDPTGLGFTVAGTKGEPITPVEIVIDNPGKATITECVADVYKPVTAAAETGAKSSGTTTGGTDPALSDQTANDPNTTGTNTTDTTNTDTTTTESSGAGASSSDSSADAGSGSVAPAVSGGGLAGTGVVIAYAPEDSTTTGLPEGLTVRWDAAKSACVISGTTDVSIEDPMSVKVYVNYTKADEPADALTNTTPEHELEAPGTVQIHDTGLDDDDKDGVKNKDDKCPDTPADTQVNADGCAVAPVVGSVEPINGTVNNPIDPVTVKVTNTGNNELLECQADGLAKGLTIGWNADKTACVIEGTPTEPTPGTEPTPINVWVTYNSPDDPATVTDPLNSEKGSGTQKITWGDGDGDGVTDDIDKCPNTPAGVKVDEATGCAKTPQVGSVPPITWSIPADPKAETIPVNVLVPVANPGQATDLACRAEGLIDGLTIAYDEAQNGCVISGTPTGTEAFEGTVKVFVDYNPIDDTPDAGTMTVGPSEGKITVTKEPIPTPEPTVTTPAPEPTKTTEPPVPPAPKDSDNDGVNDDADKCPGTPTGANVDVNGCSEVPTVDTFTVTGTAGEPVNADVPVKNPGKATLTACTAKDLPTGLGVALNEAKTGCVITGKVTDPVSDVAVSVTVGYTPVDRDAPGEVTGSGTVNMAKPAPGDKDGDGVNDDLDKCPNTPSGYQVGADGCTADPTLGTATDLTGVVGEPITPITVPVNNPGGATLGDCTATGLPNGVGIKWNDDKTACVISGTPSEVADGPYTVNVPFTPVDHDPSTAKTEAKVSVTDPDDDGDGVPNSKDKCAGTPKDVTVDANGCSVKPSVGTVPDVNGEINKPIDPVVIPVDNAGGATGLECKATGLAAGLTIKYDEAKNTCVIEGTPTEEKTGKITVEVTYNPVDDGTDTPQGPVTSEGTISVVDKDKDKDGVDDSVDQCLDTPTGAVVDKNTKSETYGCSVAPGIGEVPAIDGTVGELIEKITIPVTNDGKVTLGECVAVGLPKGVTIKWADEFKTACVIEGTPEEPAGGTYTVSVTYDPADDNTETDKKVDKNGAINVTKPAPGDDDGDGVNDDLDKCANTPSGAKVDANGCSLRPSLGKVPDLTGEVGTPIKDVEVSITNDGNAHVIACSATDLPAGLKIALNDTASACVISGTPTAPVDGANFKVTVTYDPLDDGKTDYGEEIPSLTGEGSATIKAAPKSPAGGTTGGGFIWDFFFPTETPDNPPVASDNMTPRYALPGQNDLPPVAGVNEMAPKIQDPIAPAMVPARPLMPETLARTGAMAVPMLTAVAVALIVGGFLVLRRGRTEEE